MVPDRTLFAAPAEKVAPTLLGAEVVSRMGGEQVRVRITEVEAYEGSRDPASHAFRGPTPRNAVMFGEPGHLYCYFVYGMHWCANVICERAGLAAGVLLRAGEVIEGADVVAERTRSRLPAAKRASGPARLARALGVTGEQSGLDLLDENSVVHLAALGPPADYETGPRVGVSAAADHSWRFWLPDEPSVSTYRRGRRVRGSDTGQTGAP